MKFLGCGIFFWVIVVLGSASTPVPDGKRLPAGQADRVGNGSLNQMETAPPRPPRKYRLLVIDSQSKGQYGEIRNAREEYLTSHGFLAGKNLQVVSFSIDNDVRIAEAVLRRELPKHYDVICVNGTQPTIAAKNLAMNRPEVKIVFAGVTDPVGVGVIEDFIHPPKYNFTGVCYPIPVKSRFLFIKQLVPRLKNIGLIYADMPQSHSYRRWVEKLLATEPEFKGIRVHFRMVPMITGENGNQAMAQAATRYVEELDSQVDVFVCPNDQMGVQPYFAQMVYRTARKPLVGLGRSDVMDRWGATMSIYPSYVSMGRQSGRMIGELFKGKKILDLIPEYPRGNGFAFDLNKARKFGIKVPMEMIELAGDNIVFDKEDAEVKRKQ
jgi:putative tryptophan/tyrosine transport system substrate-binding protein